MENGMEPGVFFYDGPTAFYAHSPFIQRSFSDFEYFYQEQPAFEQLPSAIKTRLFGDGIDILQDQEWMLKPLEAALLADEYIFLGNRFEFFKMINPKVRLPKPILIRHLYLKALAPMVKQSPAVAVAYTQQRLLVAGRGKGMTPWVAEIPAPVARFFDFSITQFTGSPVVDGIPLTSAIRTAKKLQSPYHDVIVTFTRSNELIISTPGKDTKDVLRVEKVHLPVTMRVSMQNLTWPVAGAKSATLVLDPVPEAPPAGFVPIAQSGTFVWKADGTQYLYSFTVLR